MKIADLTPSILALTGRSGSGKTTAIEALIARLVDRGLTVGAIKHTHHPLNLEDRGDTARFRRAGANPVILANDHEAVLFNGARTSQFEFRDVSELIARIDTAVVLIEGFRGAGSWPSVELVAGNWRSIGELAALVESPPHG